MRVYLAGPMQGKDLHNFPAFFSAALHLRGFGHKVINPAEIDMARGFNPGVAIIEQEFNMESVLLDDFKSIMFEVDAVVFLPDWESSEGARIERALAHYIGKEVYLYDQVSITGMIPDIPRKPVVSFDKAADVPRLWESLPGVKSIRLSLTSLGTMDFDGAPSDGTAEVRVDIVDSDTGESLYDFGTVTLQDGDQQILLKLDAEVELEEGAV